MASLEHLTRSTERLHLRGWEETDVDEFVRVLSMSRKHWAPWTPAQDPALSDRELFFAELHRARNGARAGTHLRLGAFLEEGPLIGMFALNEIVRGAFRSAHAAWQVAADQTGMGFGTEGVAGLLGLAFDPPPTGLGLHRVQANIMPKNAASLRIAAKHGFRREGWAARYLRIAGDWEDHVMHALTLEEYGG